MTTEPREQIVREIERHRAALAALEMELGNGGGVTWPPTGFYLTYYVVSGAIIGILGSLASFFFHIIGSLIVHQDPLLVLRVYGTVFLGEKALTTGDLNFFMLVAVVHFSVGACAGAVFHVLVNWFVPNRSLLHVVLGGLYGIVMWVVNFYFILSWLQPALVGQPFVLDLMPPWVAAVTHLIYGLTLGLLVPLGRFVPYTRPVNQ
jgi:hypothetical protein